MDFRTAAAEVEKVVEGVAKVEGPVMTGVGMFVPGAAPIVAVLGPMLTLITPDIEKALTDIAAGNDGDVFDTLVEFVNHIRQGKPNSPALSNGPGNVPEAS